MEPLCEDDGVETIDGDVVGVPDTECDTELVAQGDAVRVPDAVTDGLADANSDDIGAPDGLTDTLLQAVAEAHMDTVTVGDDDTVAEVASDGEGVPVPTGVDEPVPQGDAVWVTDAVPQ